MSNVQIPTIKRIVQGKTVLNSLVSDEYGNVDKAHTTMANICASVSDDVSCRKNNVREIYDETYDFSYKD